MVVAIISHCESEKSKVKATVGSCCSFMKQPETHSETQQGAGAERAAL